MIDKNSSDDEIIKSIIAGNDIHFRFVIDRYKIKGYALVYRMVRNEFNAQEILQEAFIKIYNSLGGFRFESQFSTWVYRVIYNTAISFLRDKRNFKSGETDDINLEDYLTDSNSKSYESEDLSNFINRIVNMLPSAYSSVITLFYINEFSVAEISEMTGETVSNIKVKLLRARNLLKNLIIKNNYIKEVL